MQNIPREDSLPEIRRAFYKTPPGIERVGFDLKSAELWVTASFTQEPALTSSLIEGRNMHVDMMLEVFGGEPDKNRPEYTVAKNVNYSMAYEAGLGPIKMYAAKGGFPPEEVDSVAMRLLRGHKKLFARQHRISAYLTEKARQLGYLPLHVEGRYRHFRSPGMTVPYYTALNALVQGGIGEFMKDVMIELDKAGYGELLILQVHDELVFDAPTGMSAEILALLTQISEDINPFKYVLQWDAKPWSEAA
jgi:DNA polymerase-1